MSGINPIQGPAPLPPTRGAAGAGVGRDEAAGKFTDTLKSALDAVNGRQQASASAIQDLLTGKSADAVPVVAEMAKADLSFKLLIGVRNKVIEAYRQTMNMQV